MLHAHCCMYVYFNIQVFNTQRWDDVMSFVCSQRLHYIWYIVTDLGFMSATVVLYSETVRVPNHPKCTFLHNVSFMFKHLISIWYRGDASQWTMNFSNTHIIFANTFSSVGIVYWRMFLIFSPTICLLLYHPAGYELEERAATTEGKVRSFQPQYSFTFLIKLIYSTLPHYLVHITHSISITTVD